MVTSSFPEEILNIEDFIAISIDALNDVFSAHENGYPYDSNTDSLISYEKKEYLQIGASLSDMKISWGIYMINILKASQTKSSGVYANTKTLNLQAKIIKPLSRVNELNLMQLYRRKLSKGDYLCLFLKDDNGVAFSLILSMPWKDLNVDLKNIEERIKVKLKY